MEKAVSNHGSSDSLAVKHIWIEIKRRKLMTLAIVVLGVALSAIYTTVQPVLYRSTSSLLIENFVPTVQAVTNPYSDLSISPDVIKANRILAESRPVIETARKNAQLALKEDDSAPNVDYAAHADGQLLYLQVLDTDASRAAAYANAWSDAFIEEMKKRAMEPVALIFKQYGDLVPKLQEDYQQKLKALQEFEEKNHFNQKEYEINLDNKKLSSLDTEESKLRLELNYLKNMQGWMRGLISVTYEDLKVIPDAKNDADLTHTKAEYERCRIALREAREKYRVGTKEGDAELNPKKESLEDAGKDLEKAVQKFAENFNKEIEYKEKSYADLKADLVAALKSRDALFTKSHTWSVLNTEAEQAKKIYDERFSQKDNTDLTSKTVFTYARPWERATESKLPYLPSWRRNIFAGFFFSLLTAILCVFALDKLDDTVRTPKDFERKADLVSMGIIPATETPMTDEEAYVVVKNKGFTFIAEALRNLHISLEVMHGSHRTGTPLTITVTSAMANEGKSMVSSNLALLFAALGRRVLLVDADLRKRSVTRANKCENNAGLRELLSGAAWTPSLAVGSTTPGFFVLPAGHTANGSLDSIQPESFVRILSQIQPNFDVIIFDTPPVLPMADACIMGQASNVTLLVVRSRQTSLRQLESAAANLRSANVKEIMCVVNGVDSADASANEYIYGYGYGYDGNRKMASSKLYLPADRAVSSNKSEKVRE